MRILLVARGPAYLPNFRPVLRALAERGHELRVCFETETERASGQLALVDDVARDHPGVSRGAAPQRRGRWRLTANHLRRGLDYLRYRHPSYEGSPQFRARARARAPVLAQRLIGSPLLLRPRAHSLLSALYRRLEAALPIPTKTYRFLDAERPDVVVVTPLVSLGGSQSDFVRAARRMGIPTAAWIYSWDNLTSKGVIHELPDRVVVWNDAQRRELEQLHRVPAERIEVTGAQAWDHWFDWEPSTTRAQFAERAGIDPERPYVLYLGSSGGGIGVETPIVERWIAAMRASGRERLESVGVLVRPHPYTSAQWDEFALEGDGTVSVFPRGGRQPVTDDARSDFFDSIHHATAVAGANTSAFIESAIVGRPVLTVPAPEFRIGQLGTPHFAHFLSEGGGLLSMPGSMEEHLAELDEALASDERFQIARQRFLEAFVRPHGLDVAATPLLVRDVERLEGATPLPDSNAVRSAAGVAAYRAVLTFFAQVVAFEERPEKRARRTSRRIDRELGRLQRRSVRGARWAWRRSRRGARALRVAAGSVVGRAAGPPSENGRPAAPAGDQAGADPRSIRNSAKARSSGVSTSYERSAGIG